MKKGWEGLLLLVGLLVCVGVHEALAGVPYIDLFRGRNQSEYMVRLNSSILSLETVGMDNQVHSSSCHGNFILYDYPDFNGGPALATYDFVTKFHTEDNVTVGGVNEPLSNVSSVRFIGSYVGGTHIPSLTLFRNPNFSGDGEELITTSKAVLSNGGGRIVSVIIVGVNDWTFYDYVNFNGPGLCLKGSSNYTGVQLFGRTYPPFESVNLYNKRSVEVGCWASHGIPLDQ